jgi:hypothetical protein
VIVRPDLEKYVFRPVPLVEHFLDQVRMSVQSETTGLSSAVRPEVALHLHSHPIHSRRRREV